MSQIEIELVRLFGVIGILGSFTIMVTDWAGWTKGPKDEDLVHDFSGFSLHPLAAKTFGRSRGIPPSRKIYSSIIGAVAMAPTALGFFAAFVGLSPAGVPIAAATALLLAMSMMGGVMGHAGMGMINELFESTIDLDRDGNAFHVAARNAERMTQYWLPLTVIMVLVPMALGSFLFSYTVFTKETLYPTWMGFLNVFLIMMFFQFRLFQPYAIARWTGPACVHLFAVLPFHIISTIVAWNGV